jgi:hypothetical protein
MLDESESESETESETVERGKRHLSRFSRRTNSAVSAPVRGATQFR